MKRFKLDRMVWLAGFVIALACGGGDPGAFTASGLGPAGGALAVSATATGTVTGVGDLVLLVTVGVGGELSVIGIPFVTYRITAAPPP